MITADTSTWIAFFQNDPGTDSDLLDRAIKAGQALMAPAVLAELLSDPKIPKPVAKLLCDLPLLDLSPGYWERTGSLRAKILAKGRKARLGDALIAQSCIDAGIPLLTRDGDYRVFAEAAGLTLLSV